MNSSSCVSSVMVADTTSPFPVCQEITVYLDGSGNASITAGDLDNGSTDNCGIANYTLSRTNFTCADLGPNEVTLTVFDGSLNSRSCNGTVTIIDSTSPVAVCQDITVFLDQNGTAEIVGSDLDGGSTDNCSSVSLTPSKTSFTCAECWS